MAAKKKKHSKVQSTLPDVVKPKKPVEVVVFNNPAKRKPREDNEDSTFKVKMRYLWVLDHYPSTPHINYLYEIYFMGK